MTSKSKSPTTNVPEPLLYVHCVVRGEPTAAVLARQPGMPGGAPLRAIALDDRLFLVVSAVPVADYDADVVQARLGDLDWVAGAGAAHHAVIDALFERHVVLPFRLLTLFSNEDKALAALAGRRAALAAALDRVAGKAEWVLRIGRPDPARADQPAPASAAATGTGFLQSKAAARRADSDRAARVTAAVDDVFATLQPLADATVIRPPQAAAPVLLDAAFLIDRAALDRFRATLTRSAEGLLRDGCRVSLTGPWPPYSFASIDDAAHA